MPTVAEVSPEVSAAPANDVGGRYVRAALHTGFGGVASRVLSGLAPVILARYLGPKEYGIYTLVLSLVGIVAGVSHLGQNAALQKFLPEYFVKDRRRGGAILADTVILISGTLAVVCTIFFFLSGWIATAIYHQASLTGVFQFSALLVLSMALFNLATSLVAGLQDFKSFSKARVLRSGAFLGLAWVGVWLFGLYGALGGQLLATLLGLVYLTVAAIKASRQRFPRVVKALFSRAILSEIFSFAFPAFLSGILVGPAYWWANTLLARHSDFEQVGLFGVAIAMSQLIMVIPGSLSVPAVSFMSETYASSARGKFSSLVSTNVRLIWAITLPISLGCAMLAPWIVRIAFGPAYSGAALLASMMSLVALIMVVGNVVGYAVAGSGHMWHGFVINGFWLVVFAISAMTLIPAWGASGLAWAFVISYLLLAGVLSFYSSVNLGVKFEGLKLLVALTVAGALLTVLFLAELPPAPLVAAALIAECALIGAEWHFVLDHSDRSKVSGLVVRALRIKPV